MEASRSLDQRKHCRGGNKHIAGRMTVNPHQWETVTEDVRKLSEKILVKVNGKSKPGKETWWWNECKIASNQSKLQRKTLTNRSTYKDIVQ